MINFEAWVLKVIGLALMVTSAADFFGFLVLPKTSAVPTPLQLFFAFTLGTTLLITPLTTLQGWINKAVGKKIDKV